MARIFTLFEPSDTLARDCLVIFAIGVAYKLLFVALFLARTANGSRSAPAAAAPDAAAAPTAAAEGAPRDLEAARPEAVVKADAVWTSGPQPDRGVA
jgi:hypothetical protein